MKRKKTYNYYFTEIQSVKRFWIHLVLLFEMIVFSGIIYRQLMLEKSFGPYPVTNDGLIVLSLLFLSPVIILFFIKVKITVNREEICYKMVPLGLFKHKITRRQLKKFSIETRKNKNSHEIWGLKLELKNNKNLFLPSKKPKTLFYAVQKMLNNK